MIGSIPVRVRVTVNFAKINRTDAGHHQICVVRAMTTAPVRTLLRNVNALSSPFWVTTSHFMCPFSAQDLRRTFAICSDLTSNDGKMGKCAQQ